MFHSPQRTLFTNSNYIQSIFEESITTPPPYRPDLMTPPPPYRPAQMTPPPPYIPNVTRPLESISDFIMNIHEEDSVLEIHRTVARMLDFDNYIEKNEPVIAQKTTYCNEEFECSICLNSSTCGGKLKCGHIFHENCINKWFEFKNTCPNCRDC
jgi:hypothetical protein